MCIEPPVATGMTDGALHMTHLQHTNDRETGPGTRAAVIGAVLGIVPALGLGSLRFLLAEGPESAAQITGNVAFALVYLSPYLLALIASRLRDPGVRGGLLAAIGLLSLAASFSSMALVTVVLLPATFVIWFATARSITAPGRRLAAFVPSMVAGLLIATAVGFGFFTLFGMQDAEARCWALYQGSDGQTRWESTPNVGGPGALATGPLYGGPVMVSDDGGATWRVEHRSGHVRSFCVSDVITNTEAVMSIGVLAAALLGMALASRLLGGAIVRTSETGD